MCTEVMKWVSIAALLLAMVFRHFATNHQIELNVVVSAAALVLTQAFQAKKYRWASGVLGIALLLNPAMRVFRLGGGFGLSLVVLAIAPFAISLVLRSPSLLPIPSIADRNPGSHSL